jgi:hypothetical protein
MKRMEFLKSCASGICSCTALGLLSQESVPAQSGQANPGADPEKDELKWKLNAAQIRFAKLLQILNQNLDDPVKQKILQQLGADCAQSYQELAAKYKGNLKGFLDYISTKWVEKAEYDEKAGIIRITDKAKQCTCPLVKPGVAPKEFCNCTLGWQKAIYSVVLGRPVEAEIEESILRGGVRCVFRIRIL